MLTHYRRRRALYTVAPRRPAVPRRLIATAVFLVAFLYFFGGGIVRLFGFGGPIERLPATVSVEEGGTVSVTLDGDNTKRAENGMKLFEGEEIATGGNGHATLRFFDGTQARLDANTEVRVRESTREKEGARLSLSLQRGTLWITSPAASGASVRSVATPLLSFGLPPRTEALLSPSSLSVFSAEGEGVRVTLPKHDAIAVGEGQKLALPEGDTAPRDIGSDLYAYRSPLDAAASQGAFVAESRARTAAPKTATEAGTAVPDEALTLRSPREGETAAAGTVAVEGAAGANVRSIRVNGYVVALDAETRSFAQDVSIPSGQAAFAIRVQALDAAGNTMAELQRTVKRGSGAVSAVPAPAITSPARTGETYRTALPEIVIRGTSPAEAAAIYVNNYKLQLFAPSKGTWSYLASLALGNLKPGTNTYDVVAEDGRGRKSAPVRITIEQGEGAEGVVPQGSSSPRSSAGPLPDNAPAAPGTLQVTGDAAQMGFVATGTGFLLEGKTSPQTAAVWINDYQLKLYKPGKTFWNYIASPDFQNLKEGGNLFKVVARDAEGRILDRMDVTVEYKK